MLKKGDLVRVDISPFWMDNHNDPQIEYGIMAEDYDPSSKLAIVSLFSFDKSKRFQIRVVQKAGREIIITGDSFSKGKAMSDKFKYQIGDLLLSNTIRKHIGIIINIEKDFYKTNFGVMNRITICCETLPHQIFHLPETSVDVGFGIEPGWRKINP